MDFKIDYFISYTQSDEDWAKWIAYQLEQNGAVVNFQAHDYLPGVNFITEIEQVINSAQHIILLLSKSYIKSTYCKAEWTSAIVRDPNNEHKTIIPLLIENCDIPLFLKKISHFDLSKINKENTEDVTLLIGKIKGISPQLDISKNSSRIDKLTIGKITIVYVLLIALAGNFIISSLSPNCLIYKGRNDFNYQEYQFKYDTSLVFIFIPEDSITFQDSTYFIPEFYIAKNKITYKQFYNLSKQLNFYLPTSILKNGFLTGISWDDLNNFCKKINNSLIVEQDEEIKISTTKQWVRILKGSSTPFHKFQYRYSKDISTTTNEFGLLNLSLPLKEWTTKSGESNVKSGFLVGIEDNIDEYIINGTIQEKSKRRNYYSFRPIIQLKNR